MRKTVERKPRKTAYLKRFLLSLLSEVGMAAYEFLDEGLLNPNYAFTGLSRDLLGMGNNEQLKHYKKREVYLRRNLLAVTLYRLEKEGLVFTSGKRKLTKWGVTAKGKNYLDRATPGHPALDLPAEDGKIRVVSFDIPENDRWKRDRLRTLLVSCGYSMLQRSLWTGRRPLPQFAFTEIKHLKLRHFVHIFEISERGTIRGVV